MKKFFQDFKKFATRGNVVDMAVGVIIGSAFTAIVNSLVKDILMPLIVWLFPVQDLSNLCIVLRPESVEGAGDALTWNYGNFIMAVINFLIVAFVLFIVLLDWKSNQEGQGQPCCKIHRFCLSWHFNCFAHLSFLLRCSAIYV